MFLFPSLKKLRQNSVRTIFLILLNTIMISCTPNVKPTLLATPSITFTPLVSPSPTIPATITIYTSPIPTNIAPSIDSANDIIATRSIHSMSLDSITQETDKDAQITLDDHYIYLVGIGGDRDDTLFRIPLDGGKPEKIAVSKYVGGCLDLIGPIVTRNWIIFADTPGQGPNNQGPPGKWMIRAINLQDFSERLLAKSGGVDDPLNLTPSSNFAADGDSLYWTIGAPESGQLNEDIISMMDLNTGKTVVLTRTKVDGSYWSFLRASEGRLVVEQDSDENHGGGSNIFLFDPPGEQPQALSTDGVSNLRQFDYPWVVLQVGPQNQTNDEMSIYNLQTSQTRSISLPGMYNYYSSMDGARIYWSGATEDTYSFYAIYILDLIKNTIYVYPASEKNVLFPEISIHGGVIAWLRTVEPDTGLPYSYLEWTTIK